MAHNQDQQNQQKQHKQANQNQQNKGAQKKGTPLIVERVHKIPLVNFAVSMGYSQYDKLKTSNVTVGELMGRAENLAAAFTAYFWQKVQPLYEKLQDPINKADQLACNTFDYVEDKLNGLKTSQSLVGGVSRRVIAF